MSIKMKRPNNQRQPSFAKAPAGKAVSGMRTDVPHSGKKIFSKSAFWSWFLHADGNFVSCLLLNLSLHLT